MPNNITRFEEMMRFLPWYYRDSKIMNGIIAGDAKEIEAIRKGLLFVLAQLYVDTATDYGLKLWERELGLTPREGASLELRRAQIKAKLQMATIMTPKQIESIVNLFTEQGMATVVEKPKSYHFYIKLPFEDSIKWPSELKEAVDKAKPAHLGYSYKFITELIEDLGDEQDVQDELVARVGHLLEDDYPWPARTFDGSWRLGGYRLIDGSWQLDGQAGLDGIEGSTYALDSDIEHIALNHIRFPNISDDFGRAELPLNGTWELTGEYMLGGDALPLDSGGEIEITKGHRLNGLWALDGGCQLLLDGTFCLDGSHRISEGGNYLEVRRERIRI